MKIVGENTQLLTPHDVIAFQERIWNFYQQAGRSFPWRNVNDPYRVMISEIMLQQTQTYRVLPKYEQFIGEFSSFHALAAASLRDVLTLWQGLGYNRRGKMLHEASQIIVTTYGGNLPNDPNILVALPGIGPATAASITSFAFNTPTVFIETNIRSVFIYSFFSGEEKVSDKQIMPLVEQTLDHRNPREWYYALMDYGVMLKKMHPNPSRRSHHHVTQSRFEGSDRQIRGAIIRALTCATHLEYQELLTKVEADITMVDVTRFDKIIDQLHKEEFVAKTDSHFSIR